MEKEMLALAKFKSGDGIFEKFMGWMQSDEGMGVRESIARVEKQFPQWHQTKVMLCLKSLFIMKKE